MHHVYLEVNETVVACLSSDHNCHSKATGFCGVTHATREELH